MSMVVFTGAEAPSAVIYKYLEHISKDRIQKALTFGCLQAKSSKIQVGRQKRAKFRWPVWTEKILFDLEGVRVAKIEKIEAVKNAPDAWSTGEKA